MSKAGRAELLKTLSKVILTYILSIIIIYSIINSSLTAIHNLYVSPLSVTIIAMFIMLFITLTLRTIRASEFTDYLLILSVTTLSISLLTHEYLTFSQRSLKVYILPLINIVTHDDHMVLSIDVGQLLLLAALALILAKVIRTRGILKARTSIIKERNS